MEDFNQELAVELTGETEVLTGVGQWWGDFPTEEIEHFTEVSQKRNVLKEPDRERSDPIRH